MVAGAFCFRVRPRSAQFHHRLEERLACVAPDSRRPRFGCKECIRLPHEPPLDRLVRLAQRDQRLEQLGDASGGVAAKAAAASDTLAGQRH